MHPIIQRLRKRRVVQWGLAYLAGAWVVWQAVDVLGERWGLTPAVGRAIDVVLICGILVAIVLAWFHGEQGRQRLSGTEVLVIALVLTGTGAVAGLAVSWSPTSGRLPATNRVMVFPLAVSSGTGLPTSSGEDVATMIGAALDGADPLRWIDAWPLLEERVRADVRQLQIADAGDLAVSRGAAHFIWGRLIPDADSAAVVLTLYESLTEDAVATSQATGAADAPWRAGLAAVNRLLPRLIQTAVPDVEADFAQRVPAAVVEFLAGEAAFRRADIAEAREHFEVAFSLDPAFALAGIRGAQTAAWQHDPTAAREMLQAVLQLPLTSWSEAFVQGLLAYVDFDGDEAVRLLGRAITADSSHTVAWAALGEVYRHRAPREPWLRGPRPFERALAQDSSAGYVLFHRLEEVIRDGDVGSARHLRDRFLRTSSDVGLRSQVEVMFQCLDAGPASSEWESFVLSESRNVEFAAGQFLIGARNLPCAEALFRAIMRFDTISSNAEPRYWAGLLGLTGSKLAQHRMEDARRLLVSAAEGYEALQSVIDHSTTDSGGVPLPEADAPWLDRPRPLRGIHEESLTRWSELAVLVGLLYPELADLGGMGAEDLRVNVGPDFAGPLAYRTSVLMLGLWEAYNGNASDAGRAADRLRAMAEDGDDPVLRAHTLKMAEMVGIHLAIAEGRELDALERLRGLTSNAREGWIFVELHGSLAFERLAQAELEERIGDPARALRLALGFDEPSALSYILYLPHALAICSRTARRVGQLDRGRSCDARLSELGWSLEDPPPRRRGSPAAIAGPDDPDRS